MDVWRMLLAVGRPVPLVIAISLHRAVLIFKYSEITPN